jgi:hypothetical protein
MARNALWVMELNFSCCSTTWKTEFLQRLANFREEKLKLGKHAKLFAPFNLMNINQCAGAASIFVSSQSLKDGLIPEAKANFGPNANLCTSKGYPRVGAINYSGRK